ncbi:hypothetical protein GBAR_LOCUS29482, partial [Geodia barretti]
LKYGVTNPKPRARRQVLSADIHLHIELVASQMPSIFILRHQVGHARVHNRNLAFRVSRAVRCLSAAARAPVVANKPFCGVELSLVQYFALERLRPPHNKMHYPRVLRSIAYVVQPRFKLLHR